MQHHAFVIEAEAEEGIAVAQAWAERELGMSIKSNPDVVVMRYGLLTVDDARQVSEFAAGKAFAGEHKVVIIAASRAYHEAQNALLKLFEEPPPNTYIFLVLPTLGGLLPTLRSRVQVLKHQTSSTKFQTNTPPSRKASEGQWKHEINPAEAFMKASKEKRSAMIKKLTSGKDEEERRENREEAIAILNGIEVIAYKRRGDTVRLPQQGDTLQHTVRLPQQGDTLQQGVTLLLSDIAILRGYLYDRSAPVRMILEHLSLVIPKNLL